MTVVPGLLAAATLAYAAFMFGRYFGAACGAGLLALLRLALILVLSTGTGRVLVGWLGVEDISESQKTLAGATLGLGALSLVGFALCAAHWLTLPAALGVLGAIWLAGSGELRRTLASLKANRNLLRERPLAAAAVLGLLGLCLWCAFVPPHQYDALVYHLELPQAYIRARGFTSVPTLVYAHFPQNGEMLFALALLLKSDLLAQMFMWLAGALSAWWVFELGRREAPLSAVLLACLLLVSNTAFLLLCGIAYVEALAMLWTTAAVFCFLRWRQLDAAGPGDRGWLALSAMFLGLALGTKYYAGIPALLLGLWLLGRWLAAPSGQRRRRAGDAALLVAVSTALFLPWLIKNALLAGNPFFPFFTALFPSGHGWNAQVARSYFSVLIEYRGAWSWQRLARLPQLLLTNDPRFGGGMDVLGTLGWDIVFWSMPLAFWAAWRNRFLKGLALFCLAYFALWAATGVVLRFLLPLAPALSLLAAVGLHALYRRLRGGGRLLLGSAVSLFVTCHVLLFLFVELQVYGAGAALLGGQARDAFLGSRLDYYPCARYLSEHSRRSDKILLVGEQRGYYLEREQVVTSLQAPNGFIAWANAAADPRALAKRLAREGFAEVLYVPRELRRLGSSVGALSARGAANWNDLLRVKPEFQGPACSVYAVPGS